MSSIQKTLLGLFLILITVYGIFDVYDEIQDLLIEEEPIWYVSFEIFIVISSLCALFYFFYIVLKESKKREYAEQKLEKVKTQLESSNVRLQEGKRDYQKVIQWQFSEWKLSPSEKQIALMMLKGVSFKDIAKHRATHEKTVRKQASSVYEKSGLNGRHELSAWFFEDLL